MTPRSRRALLVDAARLSGAALVVGACGTPTPARPPPTSDHPLAGLTDFGGRDVAPPALKDHVTVVDFWASWCAPCRVEFRYLDQLYRTYTRRGLQMLGVCLDDDPAAGDAFRAYARPHFPIAWDAGGYVRDRFQVVNLPTTLLIDGEVKIAYRQTGFTPDTHRVLEDHVRRLLGA